MILTGEEIKKQIDLNNIEVDPYNENNIQPASIDLTLGSEVRVYSSQTVTQFERSPTKESHQPGEGLHQDIFHPIDPRKPQETTSFRIGESGWLLKPGILYLMHTAERVHTKKYVSVLDGKSSIGRLGVVVHLTAGYGDPGFNGQYTLEVTCIHPVILYAGMKIAQMRFHTLQGEVTDYRWKGHYVGEAAEGAIPSVAHVQFRGG